MIPAITVRTEVPPPAVLAADSLPRVDFVDSYSLRLPPDAPDIDSLALTALSDWPAWVRALLHLRDLLVAPLGLQTGGRWMATCSERPLAPGGHVGFFQVCARESGDDREELLLGGQDSHLDFCLSLLTARDRDGEQRLAVTTVVHFNNVVGRLYFVPVRPFHRLILWSQMRRLARRLARGAD